MSVYTADLPKILTYVIRHRFKLEWLSPHGNWVKNPRDAGLFSEESVKIHIQHNQARTYQTLEKAIRAYRIGLTAKTGHTPPF